MTTTSHPRYLSNPKISFGKSKFRILIILLLSVILLTSSTSALSVTGGTITTSGNYTIHTFTSNGTLNVSGTINAEILIVAGGGGGGRSNTGGFAGAGGGGAGGLIYISSYPIISSNITITVGAGGAVQTTANTRGFNGSNSTFGSYIALGGGGGCAPDGAISGYNGGSGGGGCWNGGNSGNGTIGQGLGGGISTSNVGAGGGGGNSTNGSNSDLTHGGNGGEGYLSSINGTSYNYSTGGGGGVFTNPGNGGTTYGGGTGGSNGGAGSNGRSNSGDGGGGGGTDAALAGNGGAGGSGVVIIRYIPINYINIITSSTNRYTNNTFNTTSSTSYTLLSEITLTENYTGSYNLSWLSSTNNVSYTKIYKNDIAIGAEHTTLQVGNGIIGEDFYNITILSGDKLQVYGRAGNPVDVTFVNFFKMNFDFDPANYTPTLIYPTDTSTISFSFPPLTSSINFTWTEMTSSGYEIMVAEDVVFNIIVADETTSTPYHTITLQNKTYYWKVRTYNDAGATLGAWSSTFSFTLASSTPSISGTALNGVVYELIGGSPVPIDGASVYLSNTTNTYQFLTGSNGYYLFTGLTNTTTYSIYAIKQGYDNSQTFLVIPTNNSTTTLNIPMRIYISPYIPNFVFEKIVIRTLYDEPYPGLTVNVYKGSSLSASFTGTTDYNGIVVFQLIKDQYYRMTISGGSLSSTLTFYFYAKEETQRITVATGFPTGGNKYTDINATLFVSAFNTTYSNLSLFYNDSSLTTSVINFYAKNLSTGLYPCVNQSSSTYPITLNCTVAMNGSYQFGYNATTTKYGFIQQDKIVNFNASNTTIPQGSLGSKVSTSMLNWISIIGLIFIAGLFSVRSVRYGVVVVPLMAVVLYWFGVLSVSGTIVHMALVLGVLVYIRMSEHKVNI